MIKWITALLGFTYFRFGGAILGYFLGSILEQLLKGKIKTHLEAGFKGCARTIATPLLSLAAIVIKADGRLMSVNSVYA